MIINQHYITYRHKNSNSWLHIFRVMARAMTIVKGSFMKLHEHQRTCRTQERKLWVAYFWSYSPYKWKIKDFV